MKPLIVVNICAVVLLVLGSLSNVIGFQSVKSTVNDSPLFQTRTHRAINQEQNVSTSQYLGMENRNLLRFPMRDNRTEQLKKVIDIISKMDDKTFMWFTKLCIQKARQDSIISETNNEIIHMLQLLRNQSKTIIFFFINRDNQEHMPTYEGYTVCEWAPGCLIIIMIMVIIFLFFITPIAITIDIIQRLLTINWCELS